MKHLLSIHLKKKMLMEMYEKHVPQDTREYIDSRLKPVPVAKVKPKKREVPSNDAKVNGDKPVDKPKAQVTDKVPEAPV